MMRALTLWQPYASLVELGAKRFETRDWKPDQVGPGWEVAIHAAAQKDRGSMALAMTRPFRSVLKPHYPTLDDLPLGAVLCIVRVVAWFPTEEIRDQLSPDELLFGDYEDGRFAWQLELLERFRPPIPSKGKQGFWYWPRPTEAGGSRGA